jgi:SulP family sulfate permease
VKPELFRSLKGYKREYLLSDLMAGLMVAIIALPLSIALGLQSGATLQTGIITAIVAGFFISFLGGSRFQIGGPTAAFVVIILGYLSDPQIGFAGLAIAGIAAGVLLILMGVFKAGGLVRYIPYPIVIGFTTGIGITLLTGQLKDLLGLTLPAGTGSEFIHKVIAYAQNITTANIWTAVVGVITIALIYLIPRINKKIPAAFCAIIIATFITIAIEAITGGADIATIGSTYGDVKAEFNFIDLSGIASVNFGKLVVPAVIIAFLCAIESLLSATVADGMTGTEHNPNQELIGQGVANIASSLCCGLPATGAIARTAAGINNGAKSPLTGIFHALFLLVMYVVLMPVVRYIPLTGLAAILITVSINMANFRVFARLATFGVRDGIVLATTCLLTVFFDLTYGVIGGFILCTIINLGNILRPAKIAEEQPMDDGIVARIEGRVCFMSINRLHDYAAKKAEEHGSVTLDMANVDRIDVTSAERLAKLEKKLRSRGKALSLANSAAAVEKRYNRFVEEIL